MKKFERLPQEERRKEIREAAGALFIEKGFAATTMENIVSRVSLSKGGVYRIYPSTTAILSDIMLEGMRMRNAFYEERVSDCIAENRKLTIEDIAAMVCDSLLLAPEISELYTEFLWEKRRNAELAALYDEICKTTIEETEELISKYGADDILENGGYVIRTITDFMNTAILGINVLDLREDFFRNRDRIISFAVNAMMQK